MILSLVIPIYNEENLIETLFERTLAAAKMISEDFEIICIDDGSTDKSLEKLIQCNKQDKRFKVLSLSRNFGHQAAYTAGLTYVKGDHIAMLDGDMQDPPEMIQEMYTKLKNEDLDIVYAQRTLREETFLKKKLIKAFHFVFNRMSNIHAPANVGNFSLINREALEAFLSLKEKNRYLPGLRYFIGFKQGFVSYKRPDRTLGEAKMGLKRLFQLAFDAIFSFSNLPIKFCLYIGLTGIILSMIGGSIVLVKKITGDAIPGWTSILLSIYFFGSVQLLFLGILGEYVFRIFVETQNRPIFITKKFYE